MQATHDYQHNMPAVNFVEARSYVKCANVKARNNHRHNTTAFAEMLKKSVGIEKERKIPLQQFILRHGIVLKTSLKQRNYFCYTN